jgi:hypothetical protein
METLNIQKKDFQNLVLGQCISLELPRDENLIVSSKVRTDCGLDSVYAEVVMVNRRRTDRTMLVVLKKYPPPV